MDIIFLILGLLLGSLFSYLFLKQKLSVDEKKVIEISSKIESLEIVHKSELESKDREIEMLNEKIKDYSNQLNDSEKRFKESFENLANKILEDKSKKFTELNEEKIKSILNPLRDYIKEFNEKNEKKYKESIEFNAKFLEKMLNLEKITGEVGKEADKLAHALKGDNKMQGNWGEILAERILETSGLREGTDFTREGRNLGLQSEEGKRMKPDFIINLPGEKHIIIDSKVSLVAYEKLVNDIENTEAHKKALITSIKSHVDNLSSKHYASANGLNSPEMVLLFMPIEASYTLALQAEPDVFSKAWEKRVVIVTPTTLMATLYVIANIWRQENQNKHAMEIATRGGALYDKFVLFTETLKGVGNKISAVQKEYDNAVSQLSSGKGNVIRQVEMLKELGAKTSKNIDPVLLDDSIEEIEEAIPQLTLI